MTPQASGDNTRRVVAGTAVPWRRLQPAGQVDAWVPCPASQEFSRRKLVEKFSQLGARSGRAGIIKPAERTTGNDKATLDTTASPNAWW